MTKQDVVNNIMANYRNHGVSLEWLKEMISSGEKKVSPIRPYIQALE